MLSQHMMSNLINDLLDLAKLENNSFTFSYSYFNLSETIYESVQMVLFTIHHRGIIVRV